MALSLREHCDFFRASGRPATITRAKALGVASLGERQAFASAISKHVKEQAAVAAPELN